MVFYWWMISIFIQKDKNQARVAEKDVARLTASTHLWMALAVRASNRPLLGGSKPQKENASPSIIVECIVLKLSFPGIALPI